MIRFLPLVLCLLLLPIAMIGRAAKSPAGAALQRPVALALVDDGQTLLVANRDSGSIAVLDTQRWQVASEHRVGQKLSHLAAAADRVLVTDEDAGELVVLQYKGNALQERQRLKTGLTPVSVQVSTDGRLATVACLWPRRLMIFDLGGDDAPAVLDLPFAPRCQLMVPGTAKLIVADSFGGKIALVDLQRKQVASVRTLQVHNIRDLRLDRQGTSVLFTHQVLYSQGHPTPGDIQSGNLIANNVRRLSLASVLNPLADLLRDEQLYTLGDIERGAGDPAEVAESFDGTILVTLAGVNELALGRPEQAIWSRLPMAARPTALAVDATRRRAYVANTFADSISVVDLQKPKVVAEIPLGTLPELSGQQRGEMLFFDARLSFDGWYSCHSCHTDGHSNGRLNDNFTDGSFGTPKRVLSLLGVNDTGPWAWNGDLADIESQVRTSLKSTMQGPAPTAERVGDLTAYLRTLPPPPSLAKARGVHDSAAVERGRQIFEERKCAVCHPAPTFTTPKTYDVGLRDEAGETQFNPPSLRGLSQAGPFFHDGRAASAAEALVRFRHRLPDELSAEELQNLLRYLESL